MNIKKIAAILMTTVIILTMVSCKHEKKSDKSANAEPTVKYDFSASSLSINRPTRTETRPMGEEGTWTIFVYLCGSDLESRLLGGIASMDMQEMIDSSVNEKTHFVVQTGGAKKWHNNVSEDKIERYDIHDGKAVLVDTQSYSSMGDEKTLTDFLDWGIDNYPAANMGLVFWDHGGGSINGVCFDENEKYDGLALKEIDAALYSVYNKMTEPFEFIGFDACLMSSFENASILANHANYMIASEETEPGYGWDYTEIGNYMSENPKADGLELGKKICDSFYDSCEKIDKSENATLAVIDLGKIDTLLYGFDLYAKDIYELTNDAEKFPSFVRNIYYADNFGGNNRSEGYTNMIDLGGLIDAGTDYSSIATDLSKAISDAVVYQKKGIFHNNVSGLSIYYPLSVNGSEELGIFTDICPSKYYLGLVDKLAYGAVNANISGYNNDDVLDMFSNDWGSSAYTSSGSYYSYSNNNNDNWSYADSFSPAGASNAISFSSEPMLDSNGDYTFTLNSDAINNTDYIDASVYVWLDGHTEIFELGDSGDIISDYDTGLFKDNFNGDWFALPDGQLLSVYLLQKTDEYDIYTTPVMLNDEKTNLHFQYDYSSKTATIIGVWDGVSEYGASSRIRELTNGDIIKPVYYTHNTYTNEDHNFYGKKYKYTGDNNIKFNFLPEGEYWYSFRIHDIYGDYYETAPVCFNIKDDTDSITFEDEPHKWIAATCTTPKTCAFCGITEGEALGHKWIAATFSEPKTCERCEKTEGEPLEKNYELYKPILSEIEENYPWAVILYDIYDYDGDDIKDLVVGTYGNHSRPSFDSIYVYSLQGDSVTLKYTLSTEYYNPSLNYHTDDYTPFMTN